MSSNNNNNTQNGITKIDSLNGYFLNELIRKELVLETLSNIPVKSIHLQDLSFLSSLIRDNKILIQNAMYYVSKYNKSKKLLEPLNEDIFTLKRLEEEGKLDVEYFIKLQSFLDKLKDIKKEKEPEESVSLTDKEFYINERVTKLLTDFPSDLIEDYNKKYQELLQNIKAIESYESSLRLKTKEELEFAPMLVLHSTIESYIEFFEDNNCSLDTLLGLIKFKRLLKDTTDRGGDTEALIPLAVVMAASVYIKRNLRLSNLL